MTTQTSHELRVERIHPAAKLPQQAHSGDLGLDLSCVQDITLEPMQRSSIATGLIVHFPAGWGAYIKDRSSLAVRGLHCLAGVIDSGYRGEIKVLMINLGHEPQTLRAGERIAQLVPTPTHSWSVTETGAAQTATERGSGGFGSTGR